MNRASIGAALGSAESAADIVEESVRARLPLLVDVEAQLVDMLDGLDKLAAVHDVLDEARDRLAAVRQRLRSALSAAERLS